MTKPEVWTIVKEIAPKFDFDPYIIMSMCIQEETDHDEKGFRMENNFAHWLLKRRPSLSVPDAVLLSTSYGLMQLLGQSLLELEMIRTEYLRSDIETYLESPIAQVSSGCKWLAKKLVLAGGDMHKAIALYNGAGPEAEKYRDSVLTRTERLRTEVSPT